MEIHGGKSEWEDELHLWYILTEWKSALGRMCFPQNVNYCPFSFPQNMYLHPLIHQRWSLSTSSSPSSTSRTVEKSRPTSTSTSTTLWSVRWHQALAADSTCTSTAVAMVPWIATGRPVGSQRGLSSTPNRGCSQSHAPIRRSSWWPGSRRCCRGGSPTAPNPTWRAQTQQRYREIGRDDEDVAVKSQHQCSQYLFSWLFFFFFFDSDGSKGAEECKDSLQQTGAVQDAIRLGCKVWKKHGVFL